VNILTARIHGADAYMGAAYWIPAVWVPALLVTHYLVFVVLTRRWPRSSRIHAGKAVVDGTRDGNIAWIDAAARTTRTRDGGRRRFAASPNDD
jgi:hypothetical protein